MHVHVYSVSVRMRGNRSALLRQESDRIVREKRERESARERLYYKENKKSSTWGPGRGWGQLMPDLTHACARDMHRNVNMPLVYASGCGFELIGPSPVVHGVDQWFEMRLKCR